MSSDRISFFPRLWMAIACFVRVLFRPDFAASVLPTYSAWKQTGALPAGGTPGGEPAEGAHASGLFVLSMLQREGRLLDFLQEDIAVHSDEAVGAAARVVHDGCRRIVAEYLSLEPVMSDAEGASVTVPAGFDARRIRLTGNVVGQPPFHGSLKHHGWVTRAVRLPSVPTAVDPMVLAPAEVELS